MPRGIATPVTGENVCPECRGEKVIPKPEGVNYQHNEVMFDGGDRPFIFCPKCGGEGTATAVMERIFLK